MEENDLKTKRIKKIVILTASGNNNLLLALKFKDCILSHGQSADIVNLVEIKLPVYTAKEEELGIPGVIQKYAKMLRDADGLVVLAPEYNGSVPPVLVNFIAWISRCGLENWRECFNAKPVAIGTHSGGGGLHVLMAMRMQLSFLGANVLGRQIHTHSKKELDQKSLDGVVLQLLSWRL